MLMDQSAGTIGLLALVLEISVFLTAAVFYASNKQRYEELNRNKDSQ